MHRTWVSRLYWNQLGRQRLFYTTTMGRIKPTHYIDNEYYNAVTDESPAPQTISISSPSDNTVLCSVPVATAATIQRTLQSSTAGSIKLRRDPSLRLKTIKALSTVLVQHRKDLLRFESLQTGCLVRSLDREIDGLVGNLQRMWEETEIGGSSSSNRGGGVSLLLSSSLDPLITGIADVALI
eukprot:PhF_6_TR25837/c0_g2_i1/m.36500